jgi:hypothetical protein
MSVSSNVVLRDLTTGAGRTGLTVTLRVSPFTTTAYTATEVSGKAGVYEFVDVPIAVYKLYSNGDEEISFGGANGTRFGGTMSITVGELPSAIPATKIADGSVTDAEFQYIGGLTSDAQTQLDSKLDKSGGTMTGHLTLSGKNVYCSNDPSNSASAVNWGTALITFLTLVGGTMAGIINMGGYKITNLADPIANTDAASKGWVDAVIQAYLNGALTAYQQSPNVIRVLYTGTQETNRLYTTVSAAMSAANGLVSASRYITVIVEGNGIIGSNPANYNLFSPSDVHLYCHLASKTPDVIVLYADDSYVVGSVSGDLGKVILKNLILKPNSATGNPSFQRVVFENCRFEPSDDALTLTDCEFRGLNVFKFGSSGTLAVSGVKGTPYVTNKEPSETGTNPSYTLITNL